MERQTSIAQPRPVFSLRKDCPDIFRNIWKRGSSLHVRQLLSKLYGSIDIQNELVPSLQREDNASIQLTGVCMEDSTTAKKYSWVEQNWMNVPRGKHTR